MFKNNNLIYEKKYHNSVKTGNTVEYFRIKPKYKKLEELYDNISSNLNTYFIAEQFNSISTDILKLYGGVTNLMEVFDVCPYDYVCFDSVKLIIFMIHKFWIGKLSYVIEDRICLDEEFYLKGNKFKRTKLFHNHYLTSEENSLLKKTFTYKNSIKYIDELKAKIAVFCELLSSYIKDNRVDYYVFKVNDYINEYVKEYNLVFRKNAAIVIQRAFKKYRYNPKYPFCSRIQSNNLRDIYNEFNIE